MAFKRVCGFLSFSLASAARVGKKTKTFGCSARFFLNFKHVDFE
jgi:hypothetical protein